MHKVQGVHLQLCTYYIVLPTDNILILFVYRRESKKKEQLLRRYVYKAHILISGTYISNSSTTVYVGIVPNVLHTATNATLKTFYVIKPGILIVFKRKH